MLQQITASAAVLPGKTMWVLPNPLQLIKPIIWNNLHQQIKLALLTLREVV